MKKIRHSKFLNKISPHFIRNFAVVDFLLGILLHLIFWKCFKLCYMTMALFRPEHVVTCHKTSKKLCFDQRDMNTTHCSSFSFQPIFCMHLSQSVSRPAHLISFSTHSSLTSYNSLYRQVSILCILRYDSVQNSKCKI
jgi:hypothetical protein